MSHCERDCRRSENRNYGRIRPRDLIRALLTRNRPEPPTAIVLRQKWSRRQVETRPRLPTIFNNGNFVQAGALISYGPDFSDLFRRDAELADKILRGTKPGDIPVEQPTKFDLVILTTAKAIGLTIPDSLLLRADEVIE